MALTDQELAEYGERFAAGELNPEQAAAYKTIMTRRGTPVPDREGTEGLVLDKQPISWNDVLTMAAENAPESAIQAGKDIITPLLHPVETAKALGKTAAGYAQKLIPGDQEYEGHADAINAYVAERYGSADGFKQAVASDPVGVLMDVGVLLTAGGSAAAKTGRAAKASKAGTVAGMGRAVEVAGKAVNTLGKLSDPVTVASQALKAPVAALNTIAPNLKYRLFESAIPLPAGMKASARKKIATTGMQGGITPNLKSINKIRARIDTLDADIGKMIDGVTDEFAKTGKKVDATTFVDAAKDAKNLFNDHWDPTPYWEAIDKHVARVAKMRDGMGATPKQVQRWKQSLHKELRKVYDKQSMITTTDAAIGSIGEVSAKKAIAARMRETLEALVPEIKDKNRALGDLIDLEEHVVHATNRLYNTHIMPSLIGGGGAMYVGNRLGGNVGMAIGFAASQILDMPSVKSRLARGLYNSYKPLTTVGDVARPARAAGVLSEESGAMVAP